MWSETLSRALTVVLVTGALVVMGLAGYQHFFRAPTSADGQYVED